MVLPYNEIDVVSKLALFNPIPNSKAIGKASSAKSFVVPYSCILSKHLPNESSLNKSA